MKTDDTGPQHPQHPSLREDSNDSLRPVGPDDAKESPQIFGVARCSGPAFRGRREFLRSLSGTLSLSALAVFLGGCAEDSEYGVNVDGEKCTCHVVCTCDTVADEGSRKEAQWTSRHNGTVCTCDTVCTCNTVCTCDTVHMGGGGGICTCNVVYY
jgi:hypothetical protein